MGEAAETVKVGQTPSRLARFIFIRFPIYLEQNDNDNDEGLQIVMTRRKEVLPGNVS